MEAEAFVIPPALLGVVMILIGFEAEGDRRVLDDAGLLGVIEFLNESSGVIDIGEFAQRSDAPTAEDGKIIDVRIGMVGCTHGEAVAFERLEGLAGVNIDVVGVMGYPGLILIDQAADRVIGIHGWRAIC